MPIEQRPPIGARIPRSFKAINGLRGPGAIVIAFAHLAVAMNLIAYRHLQAVLVVVDMFFVFSGLVIAQAYAEKLAQPGAIPEYMLRRVGRIWPVQTAMLAVLVAYEFDKLLISMVAGVHFTQQAFSPDSDALVSAIPTNLLLVHSIGLHDRETWNFPSWSVSVEFAVYLLFALFCLVRPNIRHVLSVLFVLVSLAVLMFVAPYHMRSTFDFGIFRCIAGFLAGTLCQEVATRWDIPRHPHPTLVEVLVIALFALWIAVSIETRAIYAAPFVISLFVMGFVAERGGISRLLRSAPLQLLAEMSFSIYMVHAVVLIFLLAGLHAAGRLFHHDVFVTVPNPLAGRPGAAALVQVFHGDSLVLKWSVVLLYFAGVSVATAAVHRFVEVPGRAAFGRLATRLGRQDLIADGTVEQLKAAS